MSGTIINAKNILRRVAPVLRKHTVQFKVISNAAILSFINSKNFSRVSSGKFITVYPEQRAFNEIIGELAEVTTDMDGPYILSDKRFAGSRIVFYRYGGFQPIVEIGPDGSRRYKMYSPNGSLVDDDRTPYFKLPSWVSDPYPNSESVHKGNRLLVDRYEVKMALKFSNSGGVYLAYDKCAKKRVVIKEARPLTNLWKGALGKCDSVN
ncbi:membrane translocator, partial [mine drainage metagenome]